jgi:hypothetical protein
MNKYIYILTIVFLLSSCKTAEIVREIPVEVPIYHTTATHDTIREYHHTTTTTSGDTIYLTERHDYHYITERATHDSVNVPVYLHDTITRTKTKSKVQTGNVELAVWILSGLLIAVALGVGVIVIKTMRNQHTGIPPKWNTSKK